MTITNNLNQKKREYDSLVLTNYQANLFCLKVFNLKTVFYK